MAFRRRSPQVNRNAFPSYASRPQPQSVPIPPSTIMLLKRLGAATILILIFLFAFGEKLGTPAAFMIGSDAIRPANEQRPAAKAYVKPKRDAPWNTTRSDGLLAMYSGSLRQPHPIRFLMRRAAQQWEDLQKRQSRTFEEAVRQYRRRYGLAPPKGFDRWYAFARANDVQLIDEYDLIMDNTKPFLAYSSSNIRKRYEFLTHWPVTEFGFSITVRNGRVELSGNAKEHNRAKGVAQLMQAYAHELPDFSAYHTAGDGPHIWLSAEERDRLLSLVQQGKTDPLEDDEPLFMSKAKSTASHALVQTCPVGSAMRDASFEFGQATNATEMPPLPPGGVIATFIADIRKALDFCSNPSWRHTHAASSWTWPLPGEHLPIFSPGVHGHFADLPSLIVEQFVDPKTYEPTPWSDRTDLRAVFRGQTSGVTWTSEWPWISRARLHLLAAEANGTRTLMLADERTNKIATREDVPNYALNGAFLDAGMTGPAVQCNAQDGTCDAMERVFQGYLPRKSLEEQSKYMFELDIDGNSWSGRFQRLMLSSAVVLKATIFPQFWRDTAIPWLHYVPVSPDYSDLHAILAYFRGGVYSELSHFDEARTIAMAGQEWARKHYRYEDLQAFQFRVQLEYARLWNEDRLHGKADYEGDMTEPIW